MSQYKPLFIGALAPILWGTTYVVVNLSLKEATPIWIAVCRALPAGLLLLLLKPQGFPVATRKMWLLSFLNISCFFICLFIAAFRLPGAVAGTLVATFPIFLLLLAWGIYGEKPQKMTLVFSGIGFAGVVLLLNPLSQAVKLDALGVLASFMGIAIFALSTLWMRQWQVKSMYSLTAWQLTLGGIMLVPVAMILESPLPTVHIGMAGGLLWLILLNTALGYLAFIYSTKHLATSVIGLLSLLNPVVAVFTGVFLANESMSFIQSLGVFMVLFALLGVVQQRLLSRIFLLRIHRFLSFKRH